MNNCSHSRPKAKKEAQAPFFILHVFLYEFHGLVPVGLPKSRFEFKFNSDF